MHVLKPANRLSYSNKCLSLKSYEERLEIVALTTLENRRIRADLIEIFKILKGFGGIDKKLILKGTYLIQGGIL